MTARTTGVHHVGLTVPDITATSRFFTETLGFAVVGGKPDYPSVFVSDGVTMITLWQATDPSTAHRFDRHRCVGLHHVALAVEGSGDLDSLHQLIANHPEASVEFGPESLGSGGARHMMCSIPGGVRLELIAARPREET